MTTLDTHAVAVLRAVLAGHTVYGDIINATGLGRARVRRRLHQLRDAGLITWDDRKPGTTRALVREVPINEREAC